MNPDIRWRVATIYLDDTATKKPSFLLALSISRAPRRSVSIRHYASALQLAPNYRWFLHYSSEVLVTHKISWSEQEAQPTTPIFSSALSRFCRNPQTEPITENKRWKERYCSNNGPVHEANEEVSTAKTVTTTFANIFTEHYVTNFEITSTVLRDSRPQFTFKFSVTVCKELGVKNVTTAEYHLQANEQVQRFNATMI